MKRLLKPFLSIVLVLGIMLSTSVSAFAASKEVYLSDLRMIYADTYKEALRILSETKLKGYQLLDKNLNSGSGETGVWLAYKTTIDVDEAITDLAVMQMGGGYSLGSYQEMIKKSTEEYVAMGEIYLQAIEYFAEAYDADNSLAKAAYRQLNFYTGLDKYEDEKLGDLLVDGVLSSTNLATLFLQGNAKVLSNIRSLLAMGVSYNEDGLHYLERVGKIVSLMGDGEGFEPFEDISDVEILIEDEDELDLYSSLIAPSIPVFRNMFEELAAYEAELNYEDEEFTELELKYAEYKSFAERMRAVEYLNGQTLYDFCMNYTLDTKDYSQVYPLAAALNEGQLAMTKTMHYYDVVRYSMSDSPEDVIDSEISAMEETYGNNPFDVYTGVDRDMYKGNFALTSAALRAEAYTDSKSLSDTLFGDGSLLATSLQIAAGALGAGLSVWAIVRSVKGHGDVETAQQLASAAAEESGELHNKAVELMNEMVADDGPLQNIINEYRQFFFKRDQDWISQKVWETMSYHDQMVALAEEGSKLVKDHKITATKYGDFAEKYSNYFVDYQKCYNGSDYELQQSVAQTIRNAKIFTGVLYVVGAATLAYSAYSVGKKIYDYYNPKYDAVPDALVDLVRTVDGDRYIKYDVVLEANAKKDGGYAAGDLNAYEGQRWNALYYTKSYEAGKPLLAKFALSNTNNRAGKDYLAVHRFGEEVCYDLNKYNFSNKSDNIFLSVAQSENQKSAVADVPDIVGTILGAGMWLIAGAAGALVGVGGTLGVQALSKKKKASEADGSAE